MMFPVQAVAGGQRFGVDSREVAVSAIRRAMRQFLIESANGVDEYVMITHIMALMPSELVPDSVAPRFHFTYKKNGMVVGVSVDGLTCGSVAVQDFLAVIQ